MRRRSFLSMLPLLGAVPGQATQGPRAAAAPAGPQILTVRGPIAPRDLGTTLMHEHVMVDFAGADKVSRDRYDPDEVFKVALPHLRALKKKGCRTLVECTPAYLARDAALLRRLSEASGLHIVTNTGYYGAADDKAVPAHAYRETPDQLAARWTEEFRGGIEGTGIRPGFLKIGVDKGRLSEIDRKLIVAAARSHVQTGLRIAVHTGDGAAALDILDTLKEEGVSPEAYVWIHAQSETDRSIHVRAAEAGAWLEFDGVGPKSLDQHVAAVTDMIRRGHLGRLLVSQDAGWYHVGEPGGGDYRGYTFLFEAFLPALRNGGVTEAQISTLLEDNPARVLTLPAATSRPGDGRPS
jgi:predicted metal-dependent phosphotriesterase family hydrolase